MCDQPSAHAQYPLARIIVVHTDLSSVIRNVTLTTPNTNPKYGDPKFPNEKAIYPEYKRDSHKIALLEFPKL